MRRSCLLIGLTALTVLTVATARGASACSCGASGPPCQNAFQVDAVFAGTVLGISALPDEGPPLPPGEFRSPQAVRVEFGDVVAFRGVQGPTLSVLTAGSGPACGYAFKQGERYLVYASRNPNGTGFVTGICSRTRRLAEADDDLGFLQTLSASSVTRGRVYGTISHWEQDLCDR
jgi:hypothetical protein